MSGPTSILVRVQARGGKFLGPDIGYSRVSIRNHLTGEVLAQGLAEGDSGQLSKLRSSNASLGTIITPQTPPNGPIVQWLSPTPPTPPATRSPTAGLLASFALSAPTLVAITAAGLTDGAKHNLTEARVWLWPGANLTVEPGLVLEMPGLAVTIVAPTAGESLGAPLEITARVTMMCGCQISPTLPWLPGEFAVTATVEALRGGWSVEIPLAFQTTSTFGATVSLPSPGEYRLVVQALQPSTANAGSASTTFAWRVVG